MKTLCFCTPCQCSVNLDALHWKQSYLLIAYRELALRLLISIREGLELLDCFVLCDFDAELDVSLRVLVAGLETVSAGLRDGSLFSNIRRPSCRRARLLESD